jgi:hypothetical protein
MFSYKIWFESFAMTCCKQVLQWFSQMLVAENYLQQLQLPFDYIYNIDVSNNCSHSKIIISESLFLNYF